MFDGSSQCTIVLPVECLGYELVVPYLAYRFALWFRIMKRQAEMGRGAASFSGSCRRQGQRLTSSRELSDHRATHEDGTAFWGLPARRAPLLV